MSIKQIHPQVVIIGAGPAGLTAAFELCKHGITGVILEADAIVGGISRTEERNGYRFDIGGHRFFTKSREIEDLWDEMLDEPMLVRPRLSRIYYGGRFYDYPLKASNALRNMGIINVLACLGSYAKAKIRPIPEPRSLEDWVINQFGSKLYRMFFKTYTEKVWGIPCSEIGADWAAQRIKGLSLSEVVRNALFGQKKGEVVKTLIDEFKYPRYGPGQLWQSCADSVVRRGWGLHKNTRVTGLVVEEGKVKAVMACGRDGERIEFPCTHVLSSMPIRDLVMGINAAPAEVVESARNLAYRDFITVSLVLNVETLFPDNWIYVHSPEVKLGRVQNFKNWSPEMVPDPSTTCLGLEYFANEGDELWTSADETLIDLGYAELNRIKLGNGELREGYVVRMPKAYPVYDTGYQRGMGLIKDWVTSLEGLYCVGRNGQHRYNNMDHSMATALIAARNIALGESRDQWAVNEDAEYHEVAKETPPPACK